ncbi:hypothetical protein EB796_015428 [Bugula neritina]|uniref:Uncharacterized protein n=1 Tax=Bugula neritina TaxID=10212 RepID=A0A7J7JL06_BUGNE|nr:hypothetical protein EB796_015428 [Bugula neritina]
MGPTPLFSNLPREFLGPTISGVVAEYANFGWAMTVYGFMCLAFVLMMIIIKLYECMKKNRPSHKTSGENTRNAIPMTMVDECKPLLK